MSTHLWPALMALGVAACANPSSDEDDTDESDSQTDDDSQSDDDGSTSENEEPVAMTLTLGEGPAVRGAATLVEIELDASAGCRAGVALVDAEATGIFLGRPSFAERAEATSSTMGPDVQLRWSSTDARAPESEADRSWSGTYEIGAWEDAHIELQLRAGELCTYPAGLECVPSEGTLVIEGTRLLLDQLASQVSQYEDLASGDLVCGAVYP